MDLQQLFKHDLEKDEPKPGKFSLLPKSAKSRALLKQKLDRIIQMVKMIIVLIIPIGNLLAMSSIVLARNIHYRQQSLNAIDSLQQSSKLGEIYILLGEEKDAAIMYCLNFTGKHSESLINIQKKVLVTNNVINFITSNTDDLTKYFLQNLSSSLHLNRNYHLKNCLLNQNISDLLKYYSFEMENVLEFNEHKAIAPENTVLWKKLISKFSLYRALSSMENEKLCGISLFRSNLIINSMLFNFIMYRDESLRMLENSFNYNEEIQASFEQKIAKLLRGCRIKCIQEMTQIFLIQNISYLDHREILSYYWLQNMSHVISITKSLIKDLQVNLLSEMYNIISASKNKLIVYILITTIVSIICISLFIFYVQQINKITAKVHKYANQISEKSKELALEKEKSEALLYQMLPPTIVNNLKTGVTGSAETFPAVSVYFSDIQNFSDLTVVISPFEVVDFLNYVYSTFDACIDQFNVYKVETIGASYMVVCGLPVSNPQHVTEVASMALELLRIAGTIVMPSGSGTVPLRSGMHTGSCVAGVIGTKMPRYCLFGDTVNTASRMQSTGQTYKIHISNPVRLALEENGGFITEERGKIFVKGKGDMLTHWLMSKIIKEETKQNGSALALQDVIDA